MLALHSTEVMSVSQSLLLHVVETESAVRGYLTTGDETFVGAYRTSLESVALTTTRLRTLVSDNPPQQALVTTIERLTRATNPTFLQQRGQHSDARRPRRGPPGPSS